MSCNLTPLDVCQHVFGDLEAVADALGFHAKSAYRWRQGGKWRKAGDLPSAEVMRSLLAAAHKRGLPLTADHLIHGAPKQELDDLLARTRNGAVLPPPGTDPAKRKGTGCALAPRPGGGDRAARPGADRLRNMTCDPVTGVRLAALALAMRARVGDLVRHDLDMLLAQADEILDSDDPLFLEISKFASQYLICSRDPVLVSTLGQELERAVQVATLPTPPDASRADIHG